MIFGTGVLLETFWVTAISFPGKENVDADKESREFNDNIVKLYGKPKLTSLHLESIRKVTRYVSWRPDPEAQFVDAFSHFWSGQPYISLFAEDRNG